MKTILAVDDSSTIRQMVTFTLKEAGYKVLCAVDGVDALQQTSEQPMDLIITDLNMPNMNGIELIRQVRSLAAYKFVPILMLTTESSPEKKQEGKAAGATGWIVKPFTPEKLVAVVQKVTRR
jgi:two-component system chemotaxis response regulator CheY